MRIVFLYRSPVDFTVETPYVRAIGGTDSALAYLSAELARLSHQVTLLTNTSEPGRYREVDCLNYKMALNPVLLNGADVVVVSNEACARELKEKFKAERPLVLWTQHADDQPAVENLQYTRERKYWSAFAFVSQWQFDQYADVFWLAREKGRVMRNAVSPVFASLPRSEPWFRTGAAPVLVYTSQPYRGLSVLLDAFPKIRSAVPDVRLKVFANLNKDYADLQRRCTTTNGVEHVGSIGQSALAGEMAGAAALAYPSIFWETSCIAAMEALAAGTAVLTTRTGALPETTAGYGHMVEFEDDPAKLAADFAGMTIEVLSAMRRNPDEWAARREAQIAHMRATATWQIRAREWSGWLQSIAAQRV